MRRTGTTGSGQPAERSQALRHFSVGEVAEQLGIAPTTVYALCQRKLIPHVRIGTGRTGRGAIRISEEALAQYLAGVTVQASEPVGPPLSPGKSSPKHRKG